MSPTVYVPNDSVALALGADALAAAKREEFFDWHATVGSWELDRYLTAF